MKMFKGFNSEGEPCIVCNTNEDKPCTLIPIIGTEDGNLMQAKAVHVDCLEFYYYGGRDPEHKIIAMKLSIV